MPFHRLCKRKEEIAGLNMEDFKIPKYVLTAEERTEDGLIPSCPILVFINTGSGGQLGSGLLETFRGIINPEQVFELPAQQPQQALQKTLENMEKLRAEGDQFATEILSKLRVVVAGGDGTAGWLLGTICDFKLKYPLPAATIPLGTGNNLPFSFGWGRKNPGTDLQSVKRILKDVADAKPMDVDSWHFLMTMKGHNSEGLGPEAPNSLHVFQCVSQPRDDVHVYRGGFWNYFSIGLDAQVSYEFHAKRKANPEFFKNQLINQGTYAMLGIGDSFHPSSSIKRLANINYAGLDGIWKELEIPPSIRSIVLLNLPSFSGGLDPWGDPSDDKSKERGLKPPSVNDGLLEVVGFRDGWHGLVLLLPKGHGTRLAQAAKVRIEFQAGSSKKHTYMRMDGEPWKQPLSENPEDTVIEISHHGKAWMLAKGNCRASNNFVSSQLEEESEDGPYPQFTAVDKDESKRKFGSASTFRYEEDA